MSWKFSFPGLIYLTGLFLPNLFWTQHKPQGYEAAVAKEKPSLVRMERIGQVLVTVSAFFESQSAYSGFLEQLYFLLSLAMMLSYEGFWIRYFRSPQTLRNFYAPFLKIPVAGATLPVMAFFLLGIANHNPLLCVSVVILGIGHIGIHWNHARKIFQKIPQNKK